MPKTNLAIRRPVALQCPRCGTFPAALFLIALATVSGGAACLWRHSRISEPEHVLGPAGIILFMGGVLQLRIAAIAWRDRRALATRQTSASILRSSRLFLTGGFVLYLAALAIGPVRYVACGWLAAVAIWYSLLLLPLTASPQVLEGWRQWTQNRAARRLGWLVTASIALVVSAEVGLQARKYSAQHDWFFRSNDTSSAAAGREGGSGRQPRAAVASRIAQSTPGLFRVAVLGEQSALRGAERQGYLARVEQSLPGLKLAPLAASTPWSSADLNRSLAEFRPDLVLAVVSVCEDLTHGSVAPTWFDWRQLELARWFAKNGESGAAAIDSPRIPAGGGDFESFLRALSPQLAACRTPIDETMRGRWQRTFAELDGLVASCRWRRVPLALVLVPGEFQVDRALCVTLARRMGCTAEQFDVDLPQRRIAGFADDRSLPLLDLLPHLRLCRKSPYEPNATAWNEQGNAVAASAIGGWLESRYGSQLASAAQLSSAP